MRYKQALSIGKSEGTIQCTYAIIYDEELQPLFALQRSNNVDKFANVDYNAGIRDLAMIPYTGDGREGIVMWKTTDLFGEKVQTGEIVFDLPVVLATEEKYWGRYVEVEMLYEAKTYITRTIASCKNVGERYQRLMERIYSNAKFYVKPAAFNWQPIEIRKTAEQETRIQKAKQKLDQAKAILIAAGATNII